MTVDVPPKQVYLYENDLLVSGKYKIDVNNKKWIAFDDIHDTDYDLPEFSKVILKVNAVRPDNQQKRLPRFSDEIESIQIIDVVIIKQQQSNKILKRRQFLN